MILGGAILLTERGSEWNRWDLHVHTASSYDYKYKADDADELLCKTLKNNQIKAVAITDHFKIDKERIEKLRTKAPEIVFFPGVELRTDKGSNNLHVILIFSEESNLKELSEDFEAIMKRQKAKSSDSDDTIYWTYEDIVGFAETHDALISLHAGRKTNGIDKEISNSIPFKEAIKDDIAETVHFFEIGQKRDVEDYEKYVFQEIQRKPLIMCSDNHSPEDYSPKERLWIKADLTFQGLKQCLYQPLERVYIGTVPPILDRFNKNKQNNLASISVERVENPVNKEEWFDFKIPLNPGMVAIIGNKGSGKSAVADILGHICQCKTMGKASFLNDKRFRKAPKKFADDYEATLMWADSETRTITLGNIDYPTTVEDAQYLPQKYIEDVCNDFEDLFQKEINKVIFSYVDHTERGEAQNLEELVGLKAKSLKISKQAAIEKLKEINAAIIRLEEKKKSSYLKEISDGLEKAKETLRRHESSKPDEVKQPEQGGRSIEYKEKLDDLNKRIDRKNELIRKYEEKLITINSFIDDIKLVVAQINAMEVQVADTQQFIRDLTDKYGLDQAKTNLILSTPKEYFLEHLNKAELEKTTIQGRLENEYSDDQNTLKSLKKEKEKLISSADAEEKLYQKYLRDLEVWNLQKQHIIGNSETENSIEFFKTEISYVHEDLDEEYKELLQKRDSLAEQLYQIKESLIEIYQKIYDPIQTEIDLLLGNLEDGITFQAEVSMSDIKLVSNIVDYINQRYNGKFGRGHNSSQEVEKLVQATDFGCKEAVKIFVEELSDVIKSDFDTADNRVAKRQEFYDYIYGLNYISVSFKLKMGERDLEELSPGERGIVLLIFYLALSKESKPIIIDQPEDNLDNQSVFSKLVPCICKAKQQRQVIIVTHNPNIAVACDAEQIIYCHMDKEKCAIQYESGSIENPKIRSHVIDVLEGTMPAFDLRRLKYSSIAEKG